mmetsp:Transcript_60353/g.178735  ORF Transcript_60353/g.178735 Transcript_60353/m.178735 type:complete len:252 (+) Transcript_60353:646-1401(+)
MRRGGKAGDAVHQAPLFAKERFFGIGGTDLRSHGLLRGLLRSLETTPQGRNRGRHGSRRCRREHCRAIVQIDGSQGRQCRGGSTKGRLPQGHAGMRRGHRLQGHGQSIFGGTNRRHLSRRNRFHLRQRRGCNFGCTLVQDQSQCPCRGLWRHFAVQRKPPQRIQGGGRLWCPRAVQLPETRRARSRDAGIQRHAAHYEASLYARGNDVSLGPGQGGHDRAHRGGTRTVPPRPPEIVYGGNHRKDTGPRPAR